MPQGHTFCSSRYISLDRMRHRRPNCAPLVRRTRDSYITIYNATNCSPDGPRTFNRFSYYTTTRKAIPSNTEFSSGIRGGLREASLTLQIAAYTLPYELHYRWRPPKWHRIQLRSSAHSATTAYRSDLGTSKCPKKSSLPMPGTPGQPR